MYNEDPPNLEDQKELSLWVCRQHNYVNKILGKPQYSCDYEGLMKRWKTGCDFDSYWIALLIIWFKLLLFFTFMKIYIILLTYACYFLTIVLCEVSQVYSNNVGNFIGDENYTKILKQEFKR